MKKRNYLVRNLFGIACAVVVLACSGCSKPVESNENPTVGPTIIEAANPTATLAPTATSTPAPTATPEPTATSTPTPTPEPTATSTPTPTPEPTATPVPTEIPEVDPADREASKKLVLDNIANGVYSSYDNKSDQWCFRRMKEHVPSETYEIFNIDPFDAYYLDEDVTDEDKVIYMTIDCGYGSENTPLMLDIFKKHDIKIMFFVTKFFIDANPEYVKRMIDEGHMVGNHSVSHKELSKLTDEQIYEEIVGCEEAFYKATGQQMDLYFRPPSGNYSERTLKITQDLGYKTIFWSIAYGDYDQNNQPGKAYVVNHFDTYHHNGAIPLMHNDSQSNLEAMDDVLTLLKEQGYRFGTLDELQ